MSNMSNEPTSTFPTYGTQPAGTLPPAPMPAAAQPHHDVHRGTHRPSFRRPDWLKSELIAYIVVSLLILLASLVVGTGDNHTDYFRADRAWTLITFLTLGYMLSRGIAKAGNGRDRYDDSNRF